MNGASISDLDSIPVHLPTPDGTWGTLSAGLLWAAGIVSELDMQGAD